MDEVVDVTKKLLQACDAQEIEVEARIRRQLVTKHSVELLLGHIGGWEVQTYSERRKISKTNRKCTYRSRCDGGASVTICKSSIAKVDVNDMWCSVHISVESPIPSMQHVLETVEPVKVTRYTTSLDGHLVEVAVSDDECRVEVEARAADELDPDSMMRVVREVCKLLQGNDVFVGHYDWKTVMHVARTNHGPFCIDKKHYQKPRTMTVDVLFDIAKDTPRWVVTPKVDGTRRFVVAFNGRAYSVDVAENVSYLGNFARDSVSVIDCEFADDIYYAFDVPVFDGAYIGGTSFDDRCSVLESVIHDLEVHMVAKPYEKFSSFDRLQKLHDAFSKKYDMDGLIFVDTRADYMQPVPKWKSHSTVDLEVRGQELFTCDSGKMEVDHVGLPDGSFGVWEFAYENGTLIAKRARPDKPQANSMHIVRKNMFESVPGTLFTGKGFYLMRKYHNAVKKRIIRDAKDTKATFLDVGTGQGGDLRKWGRASRVFCVEPNADSLLEMRDRCGEVTWRKIVPINAKLADVNPDLIDEKVDIFTAFFCMNQFGDDDWKALELVVKNKGSKKCRLLAVAITNPKEHKSENLEIVMRGTEKYNIKMHDTRIMDINECAVDISKFDKIMKKCGMKSIKRHKLDENDFMTADERRLSSMYTLFVYAKNV